MDLVSLAISILWLAIGVIVICGVVYLALMAVGTFVDVPAPVVKAIWLVVLILILIAVLTLLAGGGRIHNPFRGELPLPAYAAINHQG